MHTQFRFVVTCVSFVNKQTSCELDIERNIYMRSYDNYYLDFYCLLIVGIDSLPGNLPSSPSQIVAWQYGISSKLATRNGNNYT